MSSRRIPSRSDLKRSLRSSIVAPGSSPTPSVTDARRHPLGVESTARKRSTCRTLPAPAEPQSVLAPSRLCNARSPAVIALRATSKPDVLWLWAADASRP